MAMQAKQALHPERMPLTADVVAAGQEIVQTWTPPSSLTQVAAVLLPTVGIVVLTFIAVATLAAR